MLVGVLYSIGIGGCNTMQYSARGRHFKDPTDIVGGWFGRLRVTAFLRRERYKKRYHYYYRCVCSCGEEREYVRSNLLTGHTKSCGCLKRRAAADHPGWTGAGEISGRTWSHIKSHARSRDLVFDLTIEEAWILFEKQDRRCALTGWLLSMRSNSKGKPNAETASLDRIDSSQGYIVSNVQWVFNKLNRMKGSMPNERFIALCRAVTEHQGTGHE